MEKGQGLALPSGFPYRGQWIVENALFIYEADNSATLTNGPRFTVTAVAPNGGHAIGFEAEQLAAEWKTTPAALMEANKSGRLLWIDVEHGTSNGLPAQQFTFKLDGERLTALCAHVSPAGRA